MAQEPVGASCAESGRRSRLVAVVGLDGAGKTTQVAALADWVSSIGVPAQAHLSVSMTPVRAALTAIARQDGFEHYTDVVDQATMRLITASSKLARLAPIVASLAETPHTAIVDRFTYCQYALAKAQGAGSELFLRRLFAGLPAPDMTIFLDVDPAVAAVRIDRRGIDTEDLDFLHRFREAYLGLEEFPGFIRIDGNGSPEAVQEALRSAMSTLLCQP